MGPERMTYNLSEQATKRITGIQPWPSYFTHHWHTTLGKLLHAPLANNPGQATARTTGKQRTKVVAPGGEDGPVGVDAHALYLLPHHRIKNRIKIASHHIHVSIEPSTRERAHRAYKKHR
jgi:hypothetical protein